MLSDYLRRVVEQSGRCLDRLKLICEEESTIIFHASDVLKSASLTRRKREVDEEEKVNDNQVEIIEDKVEEVKDNLQDKIEDLVEEELPEVGIKDEVVKDVQDRLIKLTATAEQEGMGVVETRDVLIKIAAK